MRHTIVKFGQLALLALVAFGLPASPSFAAEYWLCAQSVSMAMPGTPAALVPMWGFAMDDNNDLSDGCPGPATVPGPKLTVGSGDSMLIVHLRNDLTGPGIEEVSIVIPGQAMPTTVAPSGPVFVGNRVKSFVQEAASGGGTETYTWSNLQAGSYLYESGTHPQVQVQMGLYGAVTKNSAAGMAYAGVPYDQERDLFYSEVDPALHAAVDDGSYGTTGPTSTLDYQPKYYLLHEWDGSAWVDASIDTGTIPPDCIDGGIGQGDRLLLRLYNAGLRELAPMMLGAHFDLVAEGGKKYPFARTQYQTLLMPGSTKDAVFTPAYEDDFKIIERRLNLTDGAASGGGMQTCIMVAGVSNNAPVVTISDPADGSVHTDGDPINFAATASDMEDGPISTNLSWTSSLDGNIGSGASFSNSGLSVGIHNITASVTDSGGLSGSASRTITVGVPVPVVVGMSQGDATTAISNAGLTLGAVTTQNSSTVPSGDVISQDPSGGTVVASSATVDLIVSLGPVANTAPLVTITNPSTGATYTDAVSIPFTGTASDAEEGNLSGSLNWTSDLDGAIGVGGSFSTDTLSVGTHTIEASVTDQSGAGLTGSDSIIVHIIPASTDTLTCNSARYQHGPDRLTVEVESSDTTGALTMTAVMDGDGNNTFETALGTIPSQTGGVYRRVYNNFSGTVGVTPTATSQVRVTSSLGGQCTSYVQAK